MNTSRTMKKSTAEGVCSGPLPCPSMLCVAMQNSSIAPSMQQQLVLPIGRKPTLLAVNSIQWQMAVTMSARIAEPMPQQYLKKMFCGYLLAVCVMVECGKGFALFSQYTAMQQVYKGASKARGAQKHRMRSSFTPPKRCYCTPLIISNKSITFNHIRLQSHSQSVLSRPAAVFVVSAPRVIVAEASSISFVSEVVAAVAVVRPLRPRHFLPYGILAVFEVELLDSLALTLLLAHQHAVKVGNFPQFGVHLLARPEDQLELGEEVLVLVAVLLVVLQEVHGFLDFHAVLLEEGFEVVEVDEPLVGVLDGAVLLLLADCVFEVETVDVAVGDGEVGVGEADGEVLVAVDAAAVLLVHALLLDLLYYRVAVGDRGDEHAPDQQVRQNGRQPLLQSFLSAEHVVEAQLRRHHVVVGVLDLVVEVARSEVLVQSVEAIRLMTGSPPFFVSPDALLAEIDRHHVLHPREPPFGDVLSTAAADVEHMEQFVVGACLEVELPFDEFAHLLGVGLDEDCLDPVVECLELVGLVGLAFLPVVVLDGHLVVVTPDALLLLLHQINISSNHNCQTPVALASALQLNYIA